MTYESYRKALIGSYLEHQLESAVVKFDPTQKTVILLPGGMGSQLERTEFPYGREPNVINDIIWMDLGIALPPRDAYSLEIQKIGNEERDKYSHIVAPHGPLRFWMYSPYDELAALAQSLKWNYCVFGYDWRRPLAESSAYLRNFISEFRKRVRDNHGGYDLIPDLTIVCHSMGGTVCTHALRTPQFSNLKFRAIVTVATPFYGTSTHQERYFVGDQTLNHFYPSKDVADIVATLPGPYTLMFLPKAVYDRDGARLGLTRYPEYDPVSGNATDPFDANLIKRWPKRVRDHQRFLNQARSELMEVAKPLPSTVVPIFFNIRSSLDNTTAVELLWSDVNGNNTPPSPLVGVAGPGDGTVPFWSAWHAYAKPKNQHELKQAKDHGSLMEHGEVLDLIEAIVRTRKLPVRRARKIQRVSMTRGPEVDRVLKDWAKRAKARKAPSSDLSDIATQRAIVTRLIGGTKPRMVRRKAKSS